MSDGQSPATKRSKSEGGLSASLSGGASSAAPAREGVDVSPQGGQKAKGKQRDTRGILARMFDTIDESSEDECPDDCGGGDPQTLKHEFDEDVYSDVLGISGSPGPRPTITSAAAPPAGDEQQRGFSPSKNLGAGMQCSITPGSPSDKCEIDGEGREELSISEEFGDEFATILATDPPQPQSPTPLTIELYEVCTSKARSVREWLLTSARENAAPCACPTPLPRWDKADPKKAATCGHQQAYIISTIDVQAVLERQNQRGGSDDVPCILARTVRSCLQYNASIGLGCFGAGNQCTRGPCFKRAIAMFAGEGVEGIPKEVVLSLLKEQG